MIIVTVTVTVSDGANAKSSLIEWMPNLPDDRPWTNFTYALRHRTLQSGTEITLLELTSEGDDLQFSKCRDLVREALAPLTVNVEYTDIYSSIMRPCRKPLSWLGRHGA